ncbi:Mobile element protein [Candidatus Enterovibrio escicola]|uniref:Mobile element protein n=1 Tax=Candidatus Enterovibrio escicola TaxID=1927127 RepID=A0A2A5T2P9_9GAMM|nr:Mobile element protein [Candidatus Enterovibrio escacola]
MDTSIETALKVKGIFKLSTSWIRRLSQFGSYGDECPDEIPYIHLH